MMKFFVFLRRFDCDSEIIFTFADSNEKNKPFVIKVVCEDEQQLKDFAQDIQKLIEEKYHGADYSVSGGEL